MTDEHHDTVVVSDGGGSGMGMIVGIIIAVWSCSHSSGTSALPIAVPATATEMAAATAAEIRQPPAITTAP